MSSTPERILILGGTAEATVLARMLNARGHNVVLTLKGLTEPGILGSFRVRRGGFGGSAGLADELRTAGYSVLIDAAHPFATRLSHNADSAARLAGVPRLRLLRPAWEPTDGDRWHDVEDLAEASTRIEQLGSKRVFLSVGRVGAGSFRELRGVKVILRTVSPPAFPPLAGATVIVDRAPFTFEAELRMLTRYSVDLLVTRNSGGSATSAKLGAARRLGVPVIMVRRPTQPSGEQVEDVAQALAWVQERLA